MDSEEEDMLVLGGEGFTPEELAHAEQNFTNLLVCHLMPLVNYTFASGATAGGLLQQQFCYCTDDSRTAGPCLALLYWCLLVCPQMPCVL